MPLENAMSQEEKNSQINKNNKVLEVSHVRASQSNFHVPRRRCCMLFHAGIIRSFTGGTNKFFMENPFEPV